MTRIGARQEAEILCAFVCIAVSQNVFGRFWDALCILAIFHTSNVIFGLLKKYLNAAFQFPFLAVCILTLSETLYILSDRYEFRTQLMSAPLLSAAVFVLHLDNKSFFSQRSDAFKGFPKASESPGLIFMMLILLSMVIEMTLSADHTAVFVSQLVGGAMLLGGLNQLFNLLPRYKK